MRDIDAHVLEIAVTILEVTSDLHASRLEQHIAGKAALVIDTFTTLRLTEAVGLMITHTIDGESVEEILRPLLDVFKDAKEVWDEFDEVVISRLNELERRALELIATGLPESPF
jgi:hypothetical protein